MKRLTQEVSLEGNFETITITDLRSRLGEALVSVALGKVYLVTKQGKPMAVISRPPGETLTMEIGPDGAVGYRLSK
jgi:hypothetical protein